MDIKHHLEYVRKHSNRCRGRGNWTTADSIDAILEYVRKSEASVPIKDIVVVIAAVRSRVQKVRQEIDVLNDHMTKQINYLEQRLKELEDSKR